MRSLSLTDGEIASQNRLRDRVRGTLRDDGRRLPTGIVRRAVNVDSKVFVRKANKGKADKRNPSPHRHYSRDLYVIDELSISVL